MEERIRGRPVYLRNSPQQMALYYHENEWKIGRDPKANREEDIVMKVEGKSYSCPETENNEETYSVATESSSFEVDIKCIGKG